MGKLLQETLEELSIPEPNTGCTLWFGATNQHGYGNITRAGKTIKAHRASWEVTFGPIESGLHVLHKCDNPSCINPSHLFLGSASQNMHDMHRKGRHKADKSGQAALFSRLYSGCGNPNAKLSAEEISKIVAGGLHPRTAAFVFGISRGHVYSIRKGVV